MVKRRGARHLPSPLLALKSSLFMIRLVAGKIDPAFQTISFTSKYPLNTSVR
jgi:hypothetical protein